jgi:hypothetical protein
VTAALRPVCSHCGRGLQWRAGMGEWVHERNASVWCESRGGTKAEANYLVPRHETIADRRELCQTRTATLDGHPAVISGARNTFATVATLTGITRAEYAWPTVARIIARGGDFQS